MNRIMFFLFLCSFFAAPVSVFAKNTSKFDIVEKEGTQFIATGKIMPKKLWAEYQKLLEALKDARKAEKQARKRLKELLDEVPERETFLLNKFGLLDGALKDLGARIDALNGDVYVMRGDIETNKKAVQVCTAALNKIFDVLDKLQKELATKKPRSEGWAFGVTAYGSAEWATQKEDFMPIGGAALTALWHKGNLTMSLMFGAGASVIDGAALSWTFLPSLLFDITPYLSLGPALVVTQDLGNLEGADRMIYAGGCKLQTPLWKYFNLWAVPTFGVHIERSYGLGDPTTSFNVGLTAGGDFLFLK